VQEKSATKIPNDVPLEIVGPLGCGILTGAGSVLNSFKLKPGQSIAVFGTGGVGLSAIMAARLAGASRIFAVDKIASRLALAKELGATDVIDTSDGDPAEAIRSALPYGVDFSLNTTAAPALFRQGTACLAMRGTAGFVITPSGDVSLDNFLSSGQRWQAILMGDALPKTFIPMLLEYHRQGRFPFDRLIKFYPFERIANAFADSETGGTVKPVLRMPH
jgi:aryl-alcohol dehydrogenase